VRPTASILTGMTLSGLAIVALPDLGFAQSDPFIGIWQLNVAKSKYSPGSPPKSQTWYIRDEEGKNRKNSQVTINGDGAPSALVFQHIYDDNPRPVPGAQGYDTSAYARVDAHTINARYLKNGKAIQTGTWVVSPDGKTLTAGYTGTDANGQQINITAVYDKQ
jgi:hypothetical protein